MPFLNLSLEIREMIYDEILCPPSGVHLVTRASIEFERVERKRSELDTAKLAPSDNGESKNEKRGEDEKDLREGIGAIPPIPISILSVNRQISREATRILFRYNRFTFDLAARQTLTFLKDHYLDRTEVIKHIGFSWNSFAVGDSDFHWYWHNLSDFIVQKMHVDKATIAVPSSQRHEIIKKDKRNRAPNSTFYWWPVLFSLFDWLLEGRIQELRLGYPDVYGKLDERKMRKDGSNEFSVVSLLMRRCQGRNLNVRREDALISDDGTVLILTIVDVDRRSG